MFICVKMSRFLEPKCRCYNLVSTQLSVTVDVRETPTTLETKSSPDPVGFHQIVPVFTDPCLEVKSILQFASYLSFNLLFTITKNCTMRILNDDNNDKNVALISGYKKYGPWAKFFRLPLLRFSIMFLLYTDQSYKGINFGPQIIRKSFGFKFCTTALVIQKEL